MRKLLITALALALGLGVAYAQNITRSVQGSQDPRGPIGWDTSNSMYFPGHINAFGQNTAATKSTGTTPCTLASGSTDVAGSLLTNTSSCYVTFGSPFNSPPACLASANTLSNTVVISTTTTSFSLVSANTAATYFYICIGNQ